VRGVDRDAGEGEEVRVEGVIALSYNSTSSVLTLRAAKCHIVVINDHVFIDYNVMTLYSDIIGTYYWSIESFN